MDFLDGSLPSRTNWYIVLYFCRRKAIVFIFFCEWKFTTCLQSFAKLMRWVRLWEDGGVFGVDKCFKELQGTCFLEYRAKFSITRSQNLSIVVLSWGQKQRLTFQFRNFCQLFRVSVSENLVAKKEY